MSGGLPIIKQKLTVRSAVTTQLQKPDKYIHICACKNNLKDHKFEKVELYGKSRRGRGRNDVINVVLIYFENFIIEILKISLN